LIEIGRSVQNQPIEATRFGYGSKVIVFIGGLHAGFAPATVQIAEETAVFFTENLTTIPADITIYVIRSANPDSPSGPAHEGELSGRLNANQVDLNRNWDCRWTKDAQFRGNVVRGSGGSAPRSQSRKRGACSMPATRSTACPAQCSPRRVSRSASWFISRAAKPRCISTAT
jgi:hypothetical protein